MSGSSLTNFPSKDKELASGGFRYGFNGMERDDEVYGSGNSYTTTYRQFDSRLGRWLSVDPKSGLFPWQSSYVGLDNNPVLKNDPNGDCTICDQLEDMGIIFNRGILAKYLLKMKGNKQINVSGPAKYSPSPAKRFFHDIITLGVMEVKKVSEQTISSSVTVLSNKNEAIISKTIISTTPVQNVFNSIVFH